MNYTEISVDVNTGGACTLIANAAATSAQSPVVTLPTGAAPGTPVPVIFTPDNTCYGRKGTSPVAVNDGTDQKFLANNAYRTQLLVGERMAFISTAGGTVHWAPNT